MNEMKFYFWFVFNRWRLGAKEVHASLSDPNDGPSSDGDVFHSDAIPNPAAHTDTCSLLHSDHQEVGQRNNEKN